jgi:nicotinate-nucleotide adenylyltransferase
MRWGLFGGTFDPIHLGHLRCAEEVRELFHLDRIIFIPASKPPHKPDDDITAFRHREQMVNLAIADNPAFSVSDVENRREGKSYSVETVESILGGQEKDLELYFIVGQDAFQAVRTWKDWERLFGLCHFVVMTRPGYENRRLDTILTPEFSARFSYDPSQDGFKGPAGYLIYFRAVTFLDIASSGIRRRISENRSITYLLPDPVRHYITNEGLYRKTEGGKSL